MATANEWVAGARPRTLPMAVCPVVIGMAAVLGQPVRRYEWFADAPPAGATTDPLTFSVTAAQIVIAVLAMIVALALQIGVNYANDYSDGVRGTDDVRVGPMRLTATGAASAARVKAAAFISFGIAAAAGLGIVLLTGQWWMLAVGAVCVLAAWWYTGGKNPYGYLGLGEVMVFVFFGLVATLGTAYALYVAGRAAGFQLDFPAAEAGLGAVSHGLIASALLMANNIRDIPTDREAGKKTLAVRMGQRRARLAYCLMLAIALTTPLSLSLTGGSLWYWLVVLSWPAAITPLTTVWPWRKSLPKGTALIPALQQTSVVGLVFAATYAAAVILS